MKLIVLVIILFAATSMFAQSPAAIEVELLRHLENIANTGTYSGDYDEEKLSAENRAIAEKLQCFGKRADVLRFGFPKLKGDMYVATSKDGKLRIYSWDKQTGGTMHEFASVYQFQGKSGSVHTWVEDNVEESAGPFFHEIFQLETKTGLVYLAVSTFIASSSLAGQGLNVIRIKGEKLDLHEKLIRTGKGLENSVSFSYDFFTVEDRPERPVRLFDFNEAKREFRFPVVIEDEKTPQGRVTNKFITYRFNGTHFVRLK